MVGIVLLGGGPRGKVLFQDNGQAPWQDNWFVDGIHATVKRLDDGGLYFAAGTATKQDDPDHYGQHHAVLWTRSVFTTDKLRVSFDMQRVDTSNYGSILFYIQATGIGVAPYAQDIYAWRNLRQCFPTMDKYFNYMHLMSVSLRENVRCKRYPLNNIQTDDGKPVPYQHSLLEPMVDYKGILSFKPYRVVMEKRNPYFTLRIYDNLSNNQEETCIVDWTWDQRKGPTELLPIHSGRIGIRHMSTRRHVYHNFTVTQLLD